MSDISSLKDGFGGFGACTAENAQEVMTGMLLVGDGVKFSMAESTDY